MIEHTVPLTSLFQDPDTPSFLLLFGGGDLERTDVAADGTTTDVDLVAIGDATTTGGTVVAGTLWGGATHVYEQTDANGGGVLVFEARSGKLTYLSDKYRGHDGNDDDGAGNVLRLTVTSHDGPSGSTSAGAGGTAEVSLRINVAPTGITFRQDAEDGGGDDDNNDANNVAIAPQANDFATTGEYLYKTAYGTTNLPEISITENVEHTGREVLAVIDVQDENAVRHGFGTHEVTVSGDDRFVIRKTGGDDDERDPDRDGSTWELHTVRGATFDYETDDADGNPRNGIQIVLTFSATDGAGLSTPTPNAPGFLYDFGASSALLADPDDAPRFQNLLHLPIQLVVTIVNADQEDESDPPRRRDEDTPGLKDDESNDPDDTKDDDGDSSGDHDDDTDGGAPPPPGMSLGGIIEDFIDNMDQGEADLLEDYLLTIDDGLDIA